MAVLVEDRGEYDSHHELRSCLHVTCPHYKCFSPDERGGSEWLKDRAERLIREVE